jgi:hypothetical protein
MSDVEDYPGPTKTPEKGKPSYRPNATDTNQVKPASPEPHGKAAKPKSGQRPSRRAGPKKYVFF